MYKWTAKRAKEVEEVGHFANCIQKIDCRRASGRIVQRTAVKWEVVKAEHELTSPPGGLGVNRQELECEDPSASKSRAKQGLVLGTRVTKARAYYEGPSSIEGVGTVRGYSWQ